MLKSLLLVSKGCCVVWLLIRVILPKINVYDLLEDFGIKRN